MESEEETYAEDRVLGGLDDAGEDGVGGGSGRRRHDGRGDGGVVVVMVSK